MEKMTGDPSELWHRIGKTLWHVQLAESSIVSFYVASRLGETPSQIDLDDLLERNFKPTVGVVVGNLRKAGLLNATIDNQLSHFVSERNWLAHHIRRLHNSDLYSAAHYELLLKRLDALKRNSDEISTGVSIWLDGWAKANGVTRVEIDRETEVQLARLRGCEA